MPATWWLYCTVISVVADVKVWPMKYDPLLCLVVHMGRTTTTTMVWCTHLQVFSSQCVPTRKWLLDHSVLKVSKSWNHIALWLVVPVLKSILNFQNFSHVWIWVKIIHWNVQLRYSIHLPFHTRSVMTYQMHFMYFIILVKVIPFVARSVSGVFFPAGQVREALLKAFRMINKWYFFT